MSELCRERATARRVRSVRIYPLARTRRANPTIRPSRRYAILRSVQRRNIPIRVDARCSRHAGRRMPRSAEEGCHGRRRTPCSGSRPGCPRLPQTRPATCHGRHGATRDLSARGGDPSPGRSGRALYRLGRGMARRCVVSADGRRQIVDFLLPGDFFGLASRDRHQFGGEAVVARYPRRRVELLADADPQLARRVREVAFQAASPRSKLARFSGSPSRSYAATTALKRCSAASSPGFRSGCSCLAKRR
jgi:hypothetical protein